MTTKQKIPMLKVKRLDVPKWVKSEKRYFDFFGTTRQNKRDEESFEDYHSRIVCEYGYKRGILMFQGKEGYFLINNNLILIQYENLAWVSCDGDKVSLFKQELKKYNTQSISLEVFNALAVISRNGLLKFNSDLYEIYHSQLNENSLRKHRMNLKLEKRKRKLMVNNQTGTLPTPDISSHP